MELSSIHEQIIEITKCSVHIALSCDVKIENYFTSPNSQNIFLLLTNST